VRVGIIGGGESGVGAALLAIKVGDKPYVSDYGEIDPVYRQDLIENNVSFEERGHNLDILKTSDIIVKSPGVRDDTPIIKSLKAHGLSVISELEYGYTHSSATIIAITGSNGKTTITNLVHHILTTAGIHAVKGGNLGTCLSTLLLEDPYDVYVLEVSSFQLDDIVHFRPDIAVLSNITSDHLDRYDYNFDLYADSKLRISSNQIGTNVLIYDGGSSAIQDRLSEVIAIKIPILHQELIVKGYSVNNPFLRGRHNLFNASCAIEAVLQYASVEDQLIEKALNTFTNDDHRLQTVARINGIEWINDSKATNVDATYYGLDAMSGPTIWIAGGVDKGNDYKLLYDVVSLHVKMLICLGLDNQKLESAFENVCDDIRHASSMDVALSLAFQNAREGDTVLLSPACASFDLFKNYKDRGDQFVSGVWGLLRKRT